MTDVGSSLVNRYQQIFQLARPYLIRVYRVGQKGICILREEKKGKIIKKNEGKTGGKSDFHLST